MSPETLSALADVDPGNLRLTVQPPAAPPLRCAYVESAAVPAADGRLAELLHAAVARLGEGDMHVELVPVVLPGDTLAEPPQLGPATLFLEHWGSDAAPPESVWLRRTASEQGATCVLLAEGKGPLFAPYCDEVLHCTAQPDLLVDQLARQLAGALVRRAEADAWGSARGRAAQRRVS